MNHLALFLLLPAAWLTWRWSRLMSAALWLALGTWLAYRGIKWQWPDMWAAGYLEWLRGVSMVTGLVGAVELWWRASFRAERGRWISMNPLRRSVYRTPATLVGVAVDPREWEATWAVGRPDILAALLVASMGVDLAALLICRAWGQWGPQPFFQACVLLAMCAVSVWPRRTS
jgi:hypothetical protein